MIDNTMAATVTVAPVDPSGTWLVELAGEHDLSTAPMLERQTSHVWSRCTRVVVDLSDTTFIDSSVVNWLLRARRTLEPIGENVIVIVDGAPGRAASRILDVTGLRGVFACYPERSSAVAERDVTPTRPTAIDRRLTP